MNDLVTKYKLQKEGSAKHKCYPAEGQRVLEAVSTANEDGIEIYLFIFFFLEEGGGGLHKGRAEARGALLYIHVHVQCTMGSTGLQVKLA